MLSETPEMTVYKHNDCSMSAGLLDCGKGMQGKAGREGDLSLSAATQNVF